MQAIEVQPVSLTAAVGPLRDLGRALHEVVDHRHDLSVLVGGQVGVALERFLRAWEMAAFAAAEDALAVAASLEYAVHRYVSAERTAVRP